MSQFYGPTHRQFQDASNTRKLADRLEELAHKEFDDADREFIAGAAMFFLSSVDERGRPTVSYKGGPPGFVRITGASELIFPIYDGNGMFLSLGNIVATAQVGLLFIDFEQPRRLRLQGMARMVRDDAVLATYAGARFAVSVTVEQIFVNCGRYIHQSRAALSPHLPDASGTQPFPTWKRIDFFAGSLSLEETAKVAANGGAIPLDVYRGEIEPPIT